MRYVRVWVMTVLATALVVGVACAEGRSITVTGDAEVLVPPDQVVIRLAVVTQTKDLMEAQKKNDGLVDKVLEAIKKHGVDPAHVQTSCGSLRPAYEYDESPAGSRKQKFVGYSAEKTIVVTLKRLSAFSEVLSGALQAGASRFDGISFRTSELRKHRDQARIMAVKAAREKAELLAGQLGQKVGKPTKIAEELRSDDFRPRYPSQVQNQAQNVSSEEGDSENSSAAFSPGQISVKAKVSVVFDLE